MAKNFAEIAFTDAVKKLQTKHGSRNGYERMEKFNIIDGLTHSEISFIEKRDSFYMATIGTKNYPYIQHRGGPKGFLKVLDSKRLGFIDFSGNKQYVSVGNIKTNNKVSLFIMDYPNKSRLKIFAKSEIIVLKDNPELKESLNLEDYNFKPERMMIFHIEAYDWNCPQHIIQRYTMNDVEEAIIPLKTHIINLEAQIEELKSKK
ncbi:pyridoxamine 5'-phosphate oxidase family protein [Thalassobellus sediminis]|uniref:pyridoxamine 5'-phosphate oxidase family protein n=1 Tax=Thalassobellus sediminis TaxID=3367753 RepID=UPI00379AD3ED